MTSDFLPEAMPWAFMSPFRPHHSPLELTLKLTLEQCEGWGQPTPSQLKITYIFGLPKTSGLSTRRGLVPGSLWKPKSTDPQILSLIENGIEQRIQLALRVCGPPTTALFPGTQKAGCLYTEKIHR